MYDMTENENKGDGDESTEPTKYEIVTEKVVTKALGSKRIDRQAANKMAEAIDGLADDPRPSGAKALTGPYAGHYRLRVNAPGGEYRVIYRVDDDAKVVTITEAGPREGAY